MKKDKTVGISQAAFRRRYKIRPLLKGHPATAQLWRRYLTARKPLQRRPGLIGRALGNWKQFLLAEAYNDPMAIVLILAHQEMLNLLLGTGPAFAKHVPRILEGPLAHWRQLAPAQVSRSEVPMTKQTGLTEQMHDGQGNVIAPRRNAEGAIIGLLVRGKDGRFVAILKTAASIQARGNSPRLY